MAQKISTIIAITLLLAVVACNAQTTSTSLDDLIKDIFNTNNGNNNGQATPAPPVIAPTPIPTPFKPTPTKTTVLGDRTQTDQYRSCGDQRECVPAFLCKNDTISTDGTGIIDIRLGGNDCGYLEVCCDIPNKTKDPIIPPVPVEQHVGCGYRNPSGVGFRITNDNDNESEFAEFPWMVAILREEPAGDEILNLYECGGALIAPTVILTATHCVKSYTPEVLLVRAGEWDTQNRDEILPHDDRRVKEIILHERYNKGSLFNDVALLILTAPFEWQENIRPACLPDANANFDHSRCFATGWGKDSFGKEGKYQVILKKIDMPVIPFDVCQNQLRLTRLSKFFNLHESFICAGGEKNKDTCKGDGGSPLVCPIPGVKDRFYQAGVVAWGIGCGEVNVPGVYASVAYARPWINEKLSARGIDFSHFTA